MKEATGELNMTVVTVVAIAAVAAFFYAFVWPGIRTSIQRNTLCANAICPDACDTATCACTYIDEDGGTGTVTCPNKSSAYKSNSGTDGTTNNNSNGKNSSKTK